MSWTTVTLLNQNVAAGVNSAVDALGLFTVGEKRQIHGIERCVLDIAFSGFAANNNVAGRWAMVQVTDDAMAAGAVPDPFGEPTAGWVFNEALLWDDADLNLHHLHFDLRTRRRLDGARNTFALMVENSASSSASLQYYSSARILFTWR